MTDTNTGDRNTGDRNTGHRNTGHRNTGDRNTGHYNTGNFNTGDFNTITPDGGYYFNKWMSREDWDKEPKPSWIYSPKPTTWVYEDDMSDQEKAENPTFHKSGGYLRVNDMREEWQKAYESATEEEIQMVRDLPNFDADVFKEITGLDLRVKRCACEGKIVEIDGKKYKLTEV